MANAELKFRRALYYPYVTFHDARWLKAAALFWDGLDRMVPASLDVQDNAEVKELAAGEPGLVNIVRIDPYGAEASWAGYRLMSLIDSGPAEVPIDRKDQMDLTYPIYLEKLADAGALLKRGVIRRDPADPNRGLFSPTLGATYMALLAMAAATFRDLPIVSDSEQYNSLARSEIVEDLLSIGGPNEKKRAEERLAVMAINVTVPDMQSLTNVSVDQVLRFRESSSEPRREFFDTITKAADAISAGTELSAEGLVERADEFQRQIAQQTKRLREQLQTCGIKAVGHVLMLDGKVPLSGAGVIGAHAISWAVPPVTVGAVAFGVLSVIRDWRSQRSVLRASTPYSYLLDVDELIRPGSAVQRAGRGLLRLVRGA